MLYTPSPFHLFALLLLFTSFDLFMRLPLLHSFHLDAQLGIVLGLCSIYPHCFTFATYP
jgi:hypothetical protein